AARRPDPDLGFGAGLRPRRAAAAPGPRARLSGRLEAFADACRAPAAGICSRATSLEERSQSPLDHAALDRFRLRFELDLHAVSLKARQVPPMTSVWPAASPCSRLCSHSFRS